MTNWHARDKSEPCSTSSRRTRDDHPTTPSSPFTAKRRSAKSAERASSTRASACSSATPEFLRAVVDDLLSGEPELKEAAVAVATPGGSGAIRHAIVNFLEPGQAA